MSNHARNSNLLNVDCFSRVANIFRFGILENNLSSIQNVCVRFITDILQFGHWFYFDFWFSSFWQCAIGSSSKICFFRLWIHFLHNAHRQLRPNCINMNSVYVVSIFIFYFWIKISTLTFSCFILQFKSEIYISFPFVVLNQIQEGGRTNLNLKFLVF